MLGQDVGQEAPDVGRLPEVHAPPSRHRAHPCGKLHCYGAGQDAVCAAREYKRLDQRGVRGFPWRWHELAEGVDQAVVKAELGGCQQVAVQRLLRRWGCRHQVGHVGRLHGGLAARTQVNREACREHRSAGLGWRLHCRHAMCCWNASRSAWKAANSALRPTCPWKRTRCCK